MCFLFFTSQSIVMVMWRLPAQLTTLFPGYKLFFTGPRSAVGSDAECRYRGREFWISTRSHTFVKICHEIKSKVIVVRLQAKVCARSLINRLVKLVHEKVCRLNMTIAVDLDVENQTDKQASFFSYCTYYFRWEGKKERRNAKYYVLLLFTEKAGDNKSWLSAVI